MKTKLLACSALIICGTHVSFAQETGAGDAEASETKRLSTVTVNAQRRDQELLDVPVAITSMNAEVLEAQQIDDIIDLNRANPSVFSNSLSSPLSNAPVRIRGIGTGGGNPGFEGAVGVYIDEVYRSRAGAALTTFFDMSGVDILRGPQGTLFGKNTTAGAIVQRTQAPILGEFEAYISGEVANYGSTEIEAAINLPVNDRVSFRISGITDDTDGFFTNPVNGQDTAATEQDAFRIQLLAEPTDDLTVRVAYDWSNWWTTGNYGRSTRADNRDIDGRQNFVFPGLALNTAIGSSGYWYWDATDPTNPGPADPYSYHIATQQLADQDLTQEGFGLYVDYDLNEDVTLRSITSYREIDSDNDNGDWDFGPIAIAGRLDVGQDFETFSQEFLLDGRKGNVDYIAGVHYFNETIDYTRLATAGPVFALLFGGAPGAAPFANVDYAFQDLTSQQEETSWGVFGHADIELTDQLNLVVGARWNQIEKDYQYRSNLGDPLTYWTDVVSNVLGFYIVDAGLQTAFPWSGSTEDEELTYNAALQWRPNEDMQLYASYSRGFKAGGFNLTENAAGGFPSAPAGTFGPGGLGAINPDGTPYTGGPGLVPTFSDFVPEDGSFAPEFVDAYEIGFRWEYLDAGRLSVTGFFSEYDDLQVSVFNGLTFEVINAGSSESKGVEIENTYQATDSLVLNAAVTFLDATYGDDVQGLPAGRARGLSPDLAITAGFGYDQPITSSIDFFADANYSYLSEMYLAEGQCEDATGAFVPFSGCDASIVGNQLALEEQDAHGVFSASVGLRAPGNWSASVFCNNCFEEEFATYAFNQPFLSGGAPMINPGAPQVYGVKLRKDF